MFLPCIGSIPPDSSVFARGCLQFDLETDWRLMADGSKDVTYEMFEKWWKQRTGDTDSSISVLPESMVNKVQQHNRLANLAAKKDAGETGGVRTAKQLWGFLRPRLRLLVEMQKKFGSIHGIYLTNRSDSLFEQKPIPKYIRDPDSSFSQKWDLAQVVALLYVTVMVPMRSGFVDRLGDSLVQVESGDVGWWTDLIIDLYFFADLGLTFRTGYWLGEGVIEVRPLAIAKNYFLGWFLLDFASCIPSVPDYVVLIIGDEPGEQSALKGLKVLRLFRLGKMLRLAKMKKILKKYEDEFVSALCKGYPSANIRLLRLRRHWFCVCSRTHCCAGAPFGLFAADRTQPRSSGSSSQSSPFCSAHTCWLASGT